MLLGAESIVLGRANAVLAGGMESMSNAPCLMPKARSGYRMGHQTVYDHMFLDGLEDADQFELGAHFAPQGAQGVGDGVGVGNAMST